MEIVVRLKPGPATGKPAFFYSATFDDKIEIIDGPVWKSEKNGGVGIGLPSRKTDEGNRVETVKLSPSTHAALHEAVVEAVKRQPR